MGRPLPEGVTLELFTKSLKDVDQGSVLCSRRSSYRRDIVLSPTKVRGRSYVHSSRTAVAPEHSEHVGFFELSSRCVVLVWSKQSP